MLCSVLCCVVWCGVVCWLQEMLTLIGNLGSVINAMGNSDVALSYYNHCWNICLSMYVHTHTVQVLWLCFCQSLLPLLTSPLVFCCRCAVSGTVSPRRKPWIGKTKPWSCTLWCKRRMQSMSSAASASRKRRSGRRRRLARKSKNSKSTLFTACRQRTLLHASALLDTAAR